MPMTNQLLEHIRPDITALSQDIADLFAKRLEQSLDTKNLRGAPPSSTTAPAEHFQDVIETTILIMTEQKEQLPDWREYHTGCMSAKRRRLASRGRLFLSYPGDPGEAPTLPEQHPYAKTF